MSIASGASSVSVSLNGREMNLEEALDFRRKGFTETFKYGSTATTYAWCRFRERRRF